MIFLFLLLLASCQQKSQWDVEHIQAKGFDSSKLTFYCKDMVNEMDVEFVLSGKEPRVYLLLHAQPLQSPDKTVFVLLKTKKTQEKIAAVLHEGGQRLLLPDSFYQKIVECLEAKEPVTLQVQGYSVSLDPASFKRKFHAWQYPPLLSNPLRLPF